MLTYNSDAETRAFCNWVESTNPSGIHNRVSGDYEVGTGDWVFRCPEWTAWLGSLQERCLWLHGIPGSGKTVLASHLTRKLDELSCAKSNAANLYYYCHYRHAQDESRPFLRWIISQLCRKAKCVPDELHDCYESNQDPSMVVLLAGLAEILDRYDHVYVTLDAVDESNERSELLRTINSLCTDPLFSTMQLLVTSRRYHDIEVAMTAVSRPLSMSNDAVKEDIRHYVSVTLQRDSKLRRWPGELLVDIEHALAEGAQGM